MKNIIDYLRLRLGMWIGFSGNKTATSIASQLSNKVENARCVNCGKNPYFKAKKGTA